MLLIMFNHHTLKRSNFIIYTWELCASSQPHKMLFPTGVSLQPECVWLSGSCQSAGSSLCSAANSQAASWRLWLDHMLLFTWSLQVLPISHPNSRGRLVRSKCSWQCKCAFLCVCVLTSALIHVSLHLLMSSAGRNTIWAVVCGKAFTLIFYLQEDCRRLIHSDVIQDSCKVLSLQGINNVWGKF